MILTTFKRYAMHRVPPLGRMLTFLFAGFILSATSQTAIIAHKSHSGTSVDFFIDPNTNFGELGPQLIQIVRLNDSTYIQVFSEFSGTIYHDTVRKNSKYSNYNQNIDSIYQQDYYKHFEYINLKNSSDTGRIKAPGFRVQQIIEKTEIAPKESETIPNEEKNTPKKKKKSYLLFLFGITGGGMLLMKLFRRSQITHSSIA